MVTWLCYKVVKISFYMFQIKVSNLCCTFYIPIICTCISLNFLMLPLNLCLTSYKSLHFLCAFPHVLYYCYYIMKKINHKPSQQCNIHISWYHTERNNQNLDYNFIFLKIKKAYKECFTSTVNRGKCR